MDIAGVEAGDAPRPPPQEPIMSSPKAPARRAAYVLGSLWLAAILFIGIAALLQTASP